jgi:hypothetical protein
MALESTQTLQEMSARNLSEEERAAVSKAELTV